MPYQPAEFVIITAKYDNHYDRRGKVIETVGDTIFVRIEGSGNAEPLPFYHDELEPAA